MDVDSFIAYPHVSYPECEVKVLFLFRCRRNVRNPHLPVRSTEGQIWGDCQGRGLSRFDIHSDFETQETEQMDRIW